jgi:hypothetical protein
VAPTLPTDIEDIDAPVDEGAVDMDAVDALTLGEPPDASLEPAPPPVDDATGYVYIHPACQSVAFLLDRMPVRGQDVRACGPRTLGGAPIENNERIICDHCGQPVGPLAMRHVVEDYSRA